MGKFNRLTLILILMMSLFFFKVLSALTLENKEQPKVFYTIHLLMEHPIGRIMKGGFLSRCAELGIKCEAIGSTDYDINKAIAEGEWILKKGNVGGIAMWGGTEGWKVLAKMAQEKNVPLVVPHFVIKEGAFPGVHGIVGANPHEYGKKAARVACEALAKRKGSFAITVGNFNFTEGAAAESFYNELKDKCPKLNVLQPVAEGYHAPKAFSIAKTIIDTHPDLIGIFTTTGAGPLNWVNAQRASDKKLCIIGVDAVQTNLNLLQKGDIYGLVAQPLIEEGKMAIDLLTRASRGEKISYINELDAPLILKNDAARYLIELNKLNLRKNPIVGYGFSTGKSVRNQELRKEIGFKLGFNAATNTHVYDEAVISNKNEDSGILGAIRNVHALLDQEVEVIAGYPSSLDTLLVSKEVFSIKKIFIATSPFLDSDQCTPYIYSLGVSRKQEIEGILLAIAKKMPGKRGLVIRDPEAISSQLYAEAIVKYLQENRWRSISLSFADAVKEKYPLNHYQIMDLKSGYYDYLWLILSSDNAGPLIKQFEDEGIDLPFFTKISWTTTETELHLALNNKKAPVYSQSYWLPGSKEASKFEDLVTKDYSRFARADIAFGYDQGIVTAQILNRVGNDLTNQKIIDAIRKDLCFAGTISGKICLDPSGRFAHRPLFLVRMDKNMLFVDDR